MSFENCFALYYVDREKLVEKLFLESCLPEMKKLVNKVFRKTCWGCKYEQPNQLAHSCLKTNDRINITICQVEQAAPSMITRMDKVLKEMQNLVSTKPEYADVTLAEFLEFFTCKHNLYPLNRLPTENTWLNRIKTALKHKEMDPKPIDFDL